MKIDLSNNEVFELQSILKEYQDNLKNLIDTEADAKDKDSLKAELNLVNNIIEKLSKQKYTCVNVFM